MMGINSRVRVEEEITEGLAKDAMRSSRSVGGAWVPGSGEAPHGTGSGEPVPPGLYIFGLVGLAWLDVWMASGSTGFAGDGSDVVEHGVAGTVVDATVLGCRGTLQNGGARASPSVM